MGAYRHWHACRRYRWSIYRKTPKSKDPENGGVIVDLFWVLWLYTRIWQSPVRSVNPWPRSWTYSWTSPGRGSGGTRTTGAWTPPRWPAGPRRSPPLPRPPCRRAEETPSCPDTADGPGWCSPWSSCERSWPARLATGSSLGRSRSRWTIGDRRTQRAPCCLRSDYMGRRRHSTPAPPTICSGSWPVPRPRPINSNRTKQTTVKNNTNSVRSFKNTVFLHKFRRLKPKRIFVIVA